MRHFCIVNVLLFTHTCSEHICASVRLAYGAAHLQGIHTYLLLCETGGGGVAELGEEIDVHTHRRTAGSVILISAQ